MFVTAISMNYFSVANLSLAEKLSTICAAGRIRNEVAVSPSSSDVAKLYDRPNALLNDSHVPRDF